MRKLILAGLGCLVLALLGAACGGSGSSGGTVTLDSEAKEAAACGQTPAKGGNLVYARQYETLTLNPYEIKNGAGDIWADEMIYSGLVRLDPQGGDEIQPALAESWDISPDGKKYTFHLRPGIKFSDGSPITAEDVAWSLNNFGNPEVNAVMAVFTGGYGTATVQSPDTVVVSLTEPVAAFLYNIAEWPAAILPKKLVEEQGEAFYKHPVSSGPFVVTDFQSGSHISFKRNPNYWEEGKPYLDTMTWNFATESNSRVLSLKSGQAQAADGIPFSQIPSLQGNSSLIVQTVRVPAWILLSLNNDKKPLGDKNVRTAINYALNREEISKVVFKGVGTLPNGLFGEVKFDSSEVKPFEFNLEKAKEYMAKSSAPNGFTMTIQYPVGFEFYKQMTLMIQQQLAAIGIKVELEEVSAAAAVEKWNTMDYEGNFPFPITSSDSPLPDEYAAFYALPSSETKGFFTGWANPKIAKKVETFQSTTDEAKRAEQWPVIQKELLEESPAVNVMNLPFVNAHSTAVCGTDVTSLGVDRLEFTWLAQEATES